jgi:hypothetical protein
VLRPTPAHMATRITRNVRRKILRDVMDCLTVALIYRLVDRSMISALKDNWIEGLTSRSSNLKHDPLCVSQELRLDIPGDTLLHVYMRSCGRILGFSQPRSKRGYNSAKFSPFSKSVKPSTGIRFSAFPWLVERSAPSGPVTRATQPPPPQATCRRSTNTY